MAMFLDFSTAAGDHVQESASSGPQQSAGSAASIWKLLHTASDCNPLPKSTSEGTDGEQTYEIIRGNYRRVGAERFHCTELVKSFYRTS